MCSKSIIGSVRILLTSLVLIGLIFSSNLHAEGKISDAFGMKLGAVFDPASAIGKASLTDGTPMYQFKPDKKFRSFDRYYVMITPKTKKIYSIWGIGDVENNEVCKKEQALIISLLQKKYGSIEKEGLFDSLYDVKQIDQGNRYVFVKCSGFMDVTIDIRYYDRKLRDLAEKERLEIEGSKVDDSGL